MHTLITAVVAASLLALGPRPSLATDGDGVLRLDDVLARIRAASPTLQAADARARAAGSVPARLRALDDPTFSWEVFDAPESLRIDHAENNILKLTQRFPFPGKRRLAGRIAEHEADGMRSDAERVALDLVVAATRAYVDLWQAHELAAIYARDGELAARLARLATERYATGEGSQADALAAELERAQLRAREATAALEIDAARAELNGLLAAPPERALGVPEPPATPRLVATVEALTAAALRRRPEVVAAGTAVAGAEERQRLADRDYFPDFELTVARFQNYQAPDGFGAMASVTIPLAYRGKYDAARAEAEAARTAAGAEARRVEAMVRREVYQAHARVRAAEIRRELVRATHLPRAEQLLRVTENDYVAGRADFTTLGDRLGTIEATRLEHVQTTADLAKARADLERAVGAPVDDLELESPPAATTGSPR